MARSSHIVFLALALAATGMAGCIENLSALSASDVEVSAMENKRVADAAAAEWDEGAILIGVMAFELTDSTETEIMPDPEVGNGLAPAWWYVYCLPGEAEAKADAKDGGDADARGGEDMAMPVPDVRAFKVAADGTLSSEEDAMAMAAGYEHEMAGDIGEWKIDSTDALGAAKTDETFRKVAEGFNASVVEGVADHEGRTAWWFAAFSADGFVVASVDAITGDLLAVEPFDFDMEIPTFEWGARDPEMWTAEPVHLEAEGVAEPRGEAYEMPFYAGSEMFGTLAIEYEQMFPTDGLHWAILDSEGELVAVDHVRSWQGGDSYEVEIEIEEAGDYTFTLYHMESAPLPVGSPLASGVPYTFVLHLDPGHPEEEDEDDG